MTLVIDRPAEIQEHIQQSVIVAVNGCHVWTGARNLDGYGLLRVEGITTRMAHRIAYLVSVGPIPEGRVIDHLCRNRACVNVDHMELVTPVENTLRGETGMRRRLPPGVARDRGTPKITLRLAPATWARLGAAAAAVGLTRAEVMRRLILWWLREPGVQVPPRPPGPDVDRIP